jgi:hypothetical protein
MTEKLLLGELSKKEDLLNNKNRNSKLTYYSQKTINRIK